ncbi:hypothetical protein [Pseudoroseomonas cervicalis]|uniref:hypothetical protein n=1 Tax=Teichococcus cervicalis TaxID=204525 RepID=UPI0022F15565|nr:hypothetical protein [Pseudoroseomonas cervicalis]WBV42737.1 hypothetical protein PFY06_16055 [Pseudoroseomonas cervicalis]
MSLRNVAGGLTSRFAHLAGLRRNASAKPGKSRADDTPATQDDVDDVQDDVDDVKDDVEDIEKRVDDLEQQGEEEEGDDPAPDPEPPAERTPDARKAFRRGAAAEKARCAAIFGAPEAASNLPLAASLAFETGLPAKQAVALLKSSAAGAAAQEPRRASLGERMSGQPRGSVGADTAGGMDRNTVDGNVAFILGAAKAARGR